MKINFSKLNLLIRTNFFIKISSNDFATLQAERVQGKKNDARTF